MNRDAWLSEAGIAAKPTGRLFVLTKISRGGYTF